MTMPRPKNHARRMALLRAATRLSLAAALLCVILWCLSLRWTAFCITQFGDNVGFKGGVVFASWTQSARRDAMSASQGLPRTLSWEWTATRRRTPIEWLPPLTAASFDGSYRGIFLPLWLLAGVALAGAAASAFPLRRLRLAGCCRRCGYPRAGLAPDTACPECGREVRHAPASPTPPAPR